MGTNRQKHSLQKLTDFETIKTKADYEHLSKEDKKELLSQYAQKAKEAGTRDEKLRIIEAMAVFVPHEESLDLRNQIWGNNQFLIVTFMHKFLRENSRMPSTMEISNEVQLSRQTVTKHLKEFEKSDFAKDEMRKFKLMKGKIMGTLYRLGMDYGDTKALKILLDVIDRSGCSQTLIENQNNFIQINGMVLSQDLVKSLKPEQQQRIEKTIRSVLNRS